MILKHTGFPFNFVIAVLDQDARFDSIEKNFDKLINQPCCVLYQSKQLDKRMFS